MSLNIRRRIPMPTRSRKSFLRNLREGMGVALFRRPLKRSPGQSGTFSVLDCAVIKSLSPECIEVEVWLDGKCELFPCSRLNGGSFALHVWWIEPWHQETDLLWRDAMERDGCLQACMERLNEERLLCIDVSPEEAKRFERKFNLLLAESFGSGRIAPQKPPGPRRLRLKESKP